MQAVSDWFDAKLRRPLAAMSSAERFLVVLVGVVGGIFPLPALTTIATLLLSVVLKFGSAQSAVAAVVNLLVTPIEFVLIPTFAKLGCCFTGEDATKFTIQVIQAAAAEGVVSLVKNASSMLIHACLAWMVLAVITAGVGLYVRTTSDRSLRSD